MCNLHNWTSKIFLSPDSGDLTLFKSFKQYLFLVAPNYYY